MSKLVFDRCACGWYGRNAPEGVNLHVCLRCGKRTKPERPRTQKQRLADLGRAATTFLRGGHKT